MAKTTSGGKKTRTTKAAQPPIHLIETGEGNFLDTSGDAGFAHIMRSYSQEALGYHEVRKMGNVYPIQTLSEVRDALHESFSNYEDLDQPGSLFAQVLKHIDDYRAEIARQLEAKVQQGKLEFADLTYYLGRGTEVVTRFMGHEVGGVVASTQVVRTMFSYYLEVTLRVITNAHGTLHDGLLKLRITPFKGYLDLDQLPVHVASEEDKARLSKRGETFRRYATGAHYIHYSGQLTRSSFWSSNSFRATGRAMIDMASFKQVDNNQFSNERYASDIEDPDDNRRGSASDEQDMTVPDDALWRTYPFLYGFSFASKQWGRMAVEDMREIKFRDDAFDKLVLNEADKRLVKVIVEDEASDFSDIIEGKGGGSIFLLHGPPGQGKTLTAEAISEELRRPLYSISVGELGVSPNELEATLREILDVATTWNAVLLLDEADIFLEERDEKDIVRNAMVGVFLRLLEYHQGVLFLTTNRVKNIDRAFYSRISIGLKFEDADQAKRRQIWVNLLEAAGIEGLDVDALAHHDINGRQIKNVIKISIKLARGEGSPVTNEIVDGVVERTTAFSVES